MSAPHSFQLTLLYQISMRSLVSPICASCSVTAGFLQRFKKFYTSQNSFFFNSYLLYVQNIYWTFEEWSCWSRGSYVWYYCYVYFTCKLNVCYTYWRNILQQVTNFTEIGDLKIYSSSNNISFS